MLHINDTYFKKPPTEFDIDLFGCIDSIFATSTEHIALDTLLDGYETLGMVHAAVEHSHAIEEDLDYFIGDEIRAITPVFDNNNINASLEGMAEALGRALVKAIELLKSFIKKVIVYVKRMAKAIKAAWSRFMKSFKNEKNLSNIKKNKNINIVISQKDAQAIIKSMANIITTDNERPVIAGTRWNEKQIPKIDDVPYIIGFDEFEHIVNISDKSKDIVLPKGIMYVAKMNTAIKLPAIFTKTYSPIATLLQAIDDFNSLLNKYIVSAIKDSTSVLDIVDTLKESGLTKDDVGTRRNLGKYLLNNKDLEPVSMKLVDCAGGINGLADIHLFLFEYNIDITSDKESIDQLKVIEKYIDILHTDVTRSTSESDREKIKECIEILNNATMLISRFTAVDIMHVNAITNILHNIKKIPNKNG